MEKLLDVGAVIFGLGAAALTLYAAFSVPHWDDSWNLWKVAAGALSVLTASSAVGSLLVRNSKASDHTAQSSLTSFMGVQTIGNPETFRGAAIVGVVDLLGFSASVKAHWNDSQNSPLERLLRIKRTVETSRNSTIAIAGDRNEPPKTVKAAYRSRIHTVSDSIVVCSATPAQVPVRDFAFQLSAVLAAIEILWDAAIEEGYTIRGAVGWDQIYWTPAETIGPAFNETYLLEKVAISSRVIIGPTLLRAIVQLPPAQSEMVRDFLVVSPDDEFIELSPILRLSRHTERLKAMEAAAGASRSKYRPLLSILCGEKQAKRPVPADLERGAAAIEHRRRQQEPQH